MFCGKCGKPAEEGSVFCAHCGGKVEQTSFVETPAAQAPPLSPPAPPLPPPLPPPVKEKKPLFLGIVITCLLAVIVAGGFIFWQSLDGGMFEGLFPWQSVSAEDQDIDEENVDGENVNEQDVDEQDVDAEDVDEQDLADEESPGDDPSQATNLDAETPEVGLGELQPQPTEPASSSPRPQTSAAINEIVPAGQIENEVSRIREQWQRDRNAIANHTFRAATLSSGITAYYENDKVKMIEVGRNVNNSIYSRIYQFDDGYLTFAYIEEQDASRLYFKNNKLFRWRYTPDANDNNNAYNYDNDFDSKQYQTWQEYALSEGYDLFAQANR